MKLLSGTSNTPLAKQIADHFSLPLINTEISEFGNGERRIWIKESLSGQDVVITQSLAHPTDTNIMELLLLCDAVERLGARDVHLLVPWLGYSLQDKAFRQGEAIAAKVVANLLSSAYVRRVYLLDVHNTSIPGFFSVPTLHLSAMELFKQHVRTELKPENIVVASPDFGGLKRARQFADMLDTELVNIDKHRDLNSGQIESSILHGDVKGKTVLVYDDTIQSGGTVVEAADTLKEQGAEKVIFFATHGPMVEAAFKKIGQSSIDQVIVTNSVAHHDIAVSKLKTIDVSPVFTTALEEWF
ncbi:MAG: ribose-phosphate pyrophosphokinase [Patescibacteria group bacterium]